MYIEKAIVELPCDVFGFSICICLSSSAQLTFSANPESYVFHVLIVIETAWLT